MAEKLSTPIIATVALYYRHRKDQHGSPWNKEHDLDLIFAAAKADGWTVEAVAGNFWFSKMSPFGRVIVKVTENNYLTGGDSNISDGLTAHGLFGRILNMVRRKERT